MTITTYNGWRNRETWLASAWFGGYILSDDEGTRFTAEYIEKIVTKYMDKDSAFVAAMIMINPARIDWCELAAYYNDEVE